MSEYHGPGKVQQSRSGKSEFVEFRGIRFYRYPDGKQWAHRAYFQPHYKHRVKGVSALHVEIWKSRHGPVPPGKLIHHHDGDTFNNRGRNLRCVLRAWHFKHHASTRDMRTERNLAHLAAIRPLTIAWHRSKAGRKQHREQSKRFWATKQSRRFICQWCSKPFESTATRAKFCHYTCKNQYAYHNSAAACFQSRRRKRP